MNVCMHVRMSEGMHARVHTVTCRMGRVPRSPVAVRILQAGVCQLGLCQGTGVSPAVSPARCCLAAEPGGAGLAPGTLGGVWPVLALPVTEVDIATLRAQLDRTLEGRMFPQA